MVRVFDNAGAGGRVCFGVGGGNLRRVDIEKEWGDE
jgi:hypothetical protein